MSGLCCGFSLRALGSVGHLTCVGLCHGAQCGSVVASGGHNAYFGLLRGSMMSVGSSFYCFFIHFLQWLHNDVDAIEFRCVKITKITGASDTSIGLVFFETETRAVGSSIYPVT